MENTTTEEVSQVSKEERKLEQAKNDRRRARQQQLMPLLRLAGIGLLIVGVIGGLIWIGETQDAGVSQPSPISNEVTAADHVYGPESAAVTIIEYADFQCPTCAAYAPLLEQLLGNNQDNVRLVYRYFPLQTIHPNATIASQAAEAADRQGKFWEMHDLIFAKQAEWNRLANPRDTFSTYAESLGLDVAQFQTDMDSKEAKNRVNADYRSGLSAGVSGTPTFFINGEPLENPKGLEAFQAVIDAKLQ
ncbi:MAG: thioredoxin domain-containing protein [Patescibacteria group bacterium]